jgi:RNA polymerase sigma factor FliA
MGVASESPRRTTHDAAPRNERGSRTNDAADRAGDAARASHATEALDGERASETQGTTLAGRALAFQVPEETSAPLWADYFEKPDVERRNRLVELYHGLVRSVVRRFAGRLPRSVDRGDLLTAGSVGLIAAITSFDPSRGVRFEVYGERRIKGALLDELRTQDWMPRPWRHRIEQHKRVLERLRAELERTPFDVEVAEALGMSRDEYRLLFGVGLPGGPGRSFVEDENEPPNGGLDVVPDSRDQDPGERLTREEQLALVAQKLTDQEYRIVYLKYWEELPMREIGELTGISESRVCKIHSRLIERLKDRLRAESEA